jgi:6-phosphogluconolactonase
MGQIVRWQVFPDTAALAHAAAARIAAAARAAIDARGVFRLALAGGHTPLVAYAELARTVPAWAGWEIYFGDERCRPINDAERNDVAAGGVWFTPARVPPGQIHGIPAELGPEEGARQYAALLAPIESFDLVLLGLGEDGHTASLFPGHALEDAEVLAVHAAPKPPPQRVSLSASRLSRTREALFLVSGADKRAAVAAWRRGADIPARHIAPSGGVDVWLDAVADAGAGESSCFAPKTEGDIA